MSHYYFIIIKRIFVLRHLSLVLSSSRLLQSSIYSKLYYNAQRRYFLTNDIKWRWSVPIKLLPQRSDKTQTSNSFHLGLEFHRFECKHIRRDGGSIDNLSARINQLNVACEMRHGGMCNVAISEMYYTVPFLQIIVSIRSFRHSL